LIACEAKGKNVVLRAQKEMDRRETNYEKVMREEVKRWKEVNGPM
jgi:hypothetical protein